MGILYRAARLSQSSQANARGRRAEKRAVANQKQRKAEQIENARYNLKKAEAEGDHLAMQHWANRLRILGVDVKFNIEVEVGSGGIITAEEQAIIKHTTDYIKSCIGHPERIEDAKRAAADYNAVVRAVNGRVEKLIELGATHEDGHPWTEGDGLSTITIEDE